MADAALDLGPEPVEAPLVDHVLQAGPVAVLAVAEVAVDGDDGLDDVGQVVGRGPHERRGQAGVGVVLPGVALAEAAADEHDVAGDAVACDGHEADVVGVDVDAVVAGEGEPDLELAGQVGLAVERLDLGHLGGDRLVAVDPQLVVGGALRLEAGRQRPGGGEDAAWSRSASGAGQHTTLRTTSPQAASVVTRRSFRVLISWCRLALVHEVELEALAGGDAQRAVGDLVGEGVGGQPLLRADGTPPGRLVRTMHE